MIEILRKGHAGDFLEKAREIGVRHVHVGDGFFKTIVFYIFIDIIE